jgi:serine/threonine protein kinase
MVARRFIPSRLDVLTRGYHPISVGDTFASGHFRVLHKLGFGGSSTVWLARDQREGGDWGRIVTLKAMRADDSSSKDPREIPEMVLSQKLRPSLPHCEAVDFQTVDHHFSVQGPNGSHLFLVFSLAGPSILAMSNSPRRTACSRRLHADLAKKVAKQTATMIHHMHCAGIVHGGKQVSSLLFNNIICRQSI